MVDGELPKAVADYLAERTEPQRAMLLELRSIILSLVPDAEETISYKIPTFEFHGPLRAVRAAARHCRLYSLNATTFSAFEKLQSQFSTSKGTVMFPVNKPLPIDIVCTLVDARMRENLAKSHR